MKPLFPVLAAFAIALAGCASNPNKSMTPEQVMGALSQHHWQLRNATDSDGHYIQELFARRDKPLELGFRDDRVHVANACNVLNGSVAIEDGKLAVKQMVSTMMACADPAVSRLDRAISSRLEKPSKYRIDEDANPPTLTLVTASGDMLVFKATDVD